MSSPAEVDSDLGGADGEFLSEVSEVLLATASGDYTHRVRRSESGARSDAVASLVNATLDELATLVANLEAERKALDQARHQLVFAEKLAAIGEISATVAHELNQPLTAIRLISDLLMSRPDDRLKDHARELERISDAARRMHRIVGGIRDFSRRSAASIVPTRAEKPVLDALAMLEHSLSSRAIATEIDLPESLPQVAADSDRVQQVFVNLISNAQHALESLPVGRPRTIRMSALLADDWLVYHVEDDGPGVPDEHIPHIFDPFYTTKRPGVGTGLGLSVSHGIVSEHGGRMRYERGSRGARFVVELPVFRLAST